MTWGDLTKFVTARQVLRRSLGLPSSPMRSHDSVLIGVPPFRPQNVPDDQIAPRKSFSRRSPFLIRFPEDKLIHEYIRKNPDVKHLPYSLNSFEPPFAKRFALRQMEVMKLQGKTKEEAYMVVAKEMQPEKEALLGRAHGRMKDGKLSKLSVLSIVQEEEERQLRRAMQQLRKAV